MAKILKIYPDNPQENLINEVIKTLNNGGLIIYPSDTIYALGCNIFDIKAMEKLAQIKKQKLEKSKFSIICNDLSHLSDFTRPIDTSVFRFLKSHLPGPFTFILEANKSLPLAYKGHKTIGIRVPDHSIPQLIVEKLGHPIASTSIRDDDEIIEYSTDPELIAEKYDHLVDIVIDSGYGDNIASTIVDLTSGEPEIIRQGKGEI
ncbi:MULTISPECIES: L-threonylcarbamoyladenylate synthase [Chryseobacterium]|jgi:tRNA threonylcarbamoyl adenosine modification protein (Sua5/YciO/YrdC/YwlC family)|uniref:Threonylcarbamoyl-AMP synthase n=2 Tax=Chryseobacterium TaxID=59732 RepID=A0A3D9B2A1_9FLAO|nr:MULTISPECIES: L-threonylcarbamoyladenylate synthase [Chryseobacterium]MBM7419643.1 tRNA threonylcarbamoyl adenosine modification protein (Sua5/YciO/YrdC/YwlC family) [Chryseobacterium sp. JUb44]MDH6209574.1 tRNA threonylcarbamoyl adenosine modification protein (Sua5/YciO/YrdC/YwlC family) [Chryseobacterium sp. BIGb0186]REC43557.1 threonylcarbamoyl-AMP synthase [Chryseobacterium sp. 5_R23647]REC47659.1 threonylcarbamoyl-AMP synthase [Chryseobacterium piscium]WSO08336.1 L-threonylcarbamoylade